MAATGENASFPGPKFSWESMDPAKFIVTADDVLKVAEKYGGARARQAVSNNCRISVGTTFSGFSQVWNIRYSIDGGQAIFRMSIDPFTGDYEILTPSK